MNLENLEEIGLTKGEIKVYDALLELGESTKTPIANASGVSHGKIYDVLERLMKKGLVSLIKKGSVKHFKVANPSHLQDFIKEKKDKVEREEKLVASLLPSLLTKFNDKKSETDAEVYKGWKGLQIVYDGIINTLHRGDINYVFGATHGADSEKTKQFFARFNKKRYEKGIKLKIIYNKEDKAFAKQFISHKRFDEVRYLDLQTPAEINICNKRVVITILTKIPVCIVITSEEAARSFIQYFKKMWSLAKK